MDYLDSEFPESAFQPGIPANSGVRPVGGAYRVVTILTSPIRFLGMTTT